MNGFDIQIFFAGKKWKGTIWNWNTLKISIWNPKNHGLERSELVPLDDLVSMLTLFFWECRCSSQLCLDLLRLLEDKTLAFVGRPSQNWLVTMLWKSESFRPQARVVDMCGSCFLLGMGGYVAQKRTP